MMDKRKDIEVVTRKSARNGKFQTSVKMAGVMDSAEFAEWWADRSSSRPLVLRQMIMEIEEGILAALSQGHQVNLGLASFYPRLSGTLSKRDADPSSEGLFVRGAVKARLKLMMGLRRKLVPVNSLSSVRVSASGVVDLETDVSDIITVGHEHMVVGRGIPIVAGRDDEGVWLEKRKKHGLERVATARVLMSTSSTAKFVFDETPPRGKYFLIVGTRSGKGEDFKVIRTRCEVRVL